MTKTELSFTLVEAESLAIMPTSEMAKKRHVTTKKIAIPQIVARVILKNSFITFGCNESVSEGKDSYFYRNYQI
jgi:hypothetical protein